MAANDRMETQAASWFARMHGPDAAKDVGAFEAWRDADRRNAAAYQRLEDTWRRSDVLRDSALLDSFRLQPRLRRRLDLDRMRVYAPALAALFVIICVGVWAIDTFRPVANPAVARSSRIGEIRTLALADGSRVTLDTDSAVVALFTTGERTIRLDRGRARFDVVHDESRPFVVIAGKARITDKGTVFDVRLREHLVEVVLLRGSAEVRSLLPVIASKPSASMLLSAGQMAAIRADQAAPIAPEPTPAQATTWVSGMLAFDGAPLAAMLAEVNRYNARHILLGDKRLATLRVTGAFRANGPADIARSLAAMFALRVQTDAKGNWTLLPK